MTTRRALLSACFTAALLAALPASAQTTNHLATREATWAARDFRRLGLGRIAEQDLNHGR
jgi:hypothetical protein